MNDDAVVDQALYERIRNTFCYYLALIVVRMVIDINDGFLNVTHTMPQHIDCHHRGSMSLRIILLDNIFRILILRS